MTKRKSWYRSWFDTEYYHILYKHRDDNEARLFIENLISAIRPSKESHILDLACGRGRHAVFLNEMGYEVTGLDLSESNIEYARQFSNNRLHFEVGDMREPFGKNRFNYIFNIFTSFGYFENWSDDLQALKMMKQALKPGGVLVLDFMNVNKVKLGLVEEEVRLSDGIEFHIERFIREEAVIKHIRFEDEGREHHYEEKVQLLEKEDFEQLFTEAGFSIKNFYGNFELEPFDPRDSERLILFAE